MTESWDEERARVELANQAEFRSILEGKRKFMEDALAEKADPAAAVQVVHDLETLRLQLDRPTIQIEITPDEHLKILDRTEQWYISREYPYPQPLRLKEQREHWEKRKTETSGK